MVAEGSSGAEDVDEVGYVVRIGVNVRVTGGMAYSLHFLEAPIDSMTPLSKGYCEQIELHASSSSELRRGAGVPPTVRLELLTVAAGVLRDGGRR